MSSRPTNGNETVDRTDAACNGTDACRHAAVVAGGAEGPSGTFSFAPNCTASYRGFICAVTAWWTVEVDVKRRSHGQN